MQTTGKAIKLKHSCCTCVFWEDDEEDGTLGWCHRHAPIVIKKSDECGGEYGLTKWPNTSPNDFCGEYEAEPEASTSRGE